MLSNTKALLLKYFSLRAGRLRTCGYVGHIGKRSRNYGKGWASQRRTVMLLLSTWPCLRRGTWKLYVVINNGLEMWFMLQYILLNSLWLGYKLTAKVHCVCSQLEAEVKRLEELKLKNIQDLTMAVREEIRAFWEKCFYSTEQRQAFLPYCDGKQTGLALQQQMLLVCIKSWILSCFQMILVKSFWTCTNLRFNTLNSIMKIIKNYLKVFTNGRRVGSFSWSLKWVG